MRHDSKHLGLHSIWGRTKKVALDFMCDKSLSEALAWRGKLISQAGREMLLEDVAIAISMYVMQSFKLPCSFYQNPKNSYALLVKHAWKMMNNLNALWAHLLKRVYFSNSNFLDPYMGFGEVSTVIA